MGSKSYRLSGVRLKKSRTRRQLPFSIYGHSEQSLHILIVIGRLKAPLLFKGGLRENEISVTLMTLTDIDKKRLKTTSRIENVKMEVRFNLRIGKGDWCYCL